MDEAAKADEAERLRLIEAGRAAEERELRLRQKEISLRREGLEEMNGFLMQARRQLENLVRELREGEVTREKTLKVKAFLSGLAEKTSGEAALLEREEAALAEALRGHGSGAAREPAPLIPGAEVFAALSGEEPRRGRLLRPDRKAVGEPAWLVEIGALRMSVPESALTPAPQTNSGALKPPPPGALVAAPGITARAELNLVGMRLEEARAALERQLDAAVLAGLGSFAVIHGKGEGVLRRGVHDCLRASPFVSGFRFSRPELGGFGRTEVVLKTETG
jgi:DNA mismatch repair protein MutS2